MTPSPISLSGSEPPAKQVKFSLPKKQKKDNDVNVVSVNNEEHLTEKRKCWIPLSTVHFSISHWFLAIEDDEIEEDYEEDDGQVPEKAATEVGVMQLLQQHRKDDEETDEYFGRGYEEEEYWFNYFVRLYNDFYLLPYRINLIYCFLFTNMMDYCCFILIKLKVFGLCFFFLKPENTSKIFHHVGFFFVILRVRFCEINFNVVYEIATAYFIPSEIYDFNKNLCLCYTRDDW